MSGDGNEIQFRFRNHGTNKVERKDQRIYSYSTSTFKGMAKGRKQIVSILHRTDLPTLPSPSSRGSWRTLAYTERGVQDAARPRRGPSPPERDCSFKVPTNLLCARAADPGHDLEEVRMPKKFYDRRFP